MRRSLLLAAMIMAFGITLYAQDKKVAVWETRCSDNSITTMQSAIIRGAMETAVANSSDYSGYDRTSFDAILKEHQFQRSGAVKDEDIKRMGEMAGVQYIIVPEAQADGDFVYILVKMLDVETGKYGSVYDQMCGTSAAEIKKASSKLGAKVVGSLYVDVTYSEGGGTITVSIGDVSFEMIKVEAGGFTMGCVDNQGCYCYIPEKPAHHVTLTCDYYIGKFEVTQELYEIVMGSNPSEFKSHNRPVENVGWEEAQQFCVKLGRITGLNIGLPTEAEWEFAARGGRKSKGTFYSGGNDGDAVAWHKDNSSQRTNPVGQKRPNELGICDMSGNVAEWCQDFVGDYTGSSQTDPKGPDAGKDHMQRGGSWKNDLSGCRVWYRSVFFNKKGSYCGFRLAIH